MTTSSYKGDVTWTCGCYDGGLTQPVRGMFKAHLERPEDGLALLERAGWVWLHDNLPSCSPECWNRYHQAIWDGRPRRYESWMSLNPRAKGSVCRCLPQWHTIKHPVRGQILLLDGFAHDDTCFWAGPKKGDDEMDGMARDVG